MRDKHVCEWHYTGQGVDRSRGFTSNFVCRICGLIDRVLNKEKD